MTVVFNGVLETKKKASGCKCRGGGGTTSTFVKSKSYILPSGRVQTFTLDHPVEVDDRDGKFLLSYSYTDANGSRRSVFSEVQ